MDSLENRLILEKSDLESYSLACLRALEVIGRTQPQRMVCLLRGGLPPSKVVYTLSEQYLQKTLDSYAIPTSDFLRNKSDLVYALAKELVDFSIISQGNGKVITIDTAISGSSSRQFMADFSEYFRQIASLKREIHNDVLLDYSFVRFWNNSEGRYSPTKNKPFVVECKQKSEKGKGKPLVLRFNVYDFGVRNLISEDNPLLLGIDYPIEFKKDDNAGIHGQKSEYTSRVLKRDQIIVESADGELVYQPHGDETTSDLFIDILTRTSKDLIQKLKHLYTSKPVRDAQGNIDMNPQNSYRQNLSTLKFPPYLVDFCGFLSESASSLRK